MSNAMRRAENFRKVFRGIDLEKLGTLLVPFWYDFRRRSLLVGHSAVGNDFPSLCQRGHGLARFRFQPRLNSCVVPSVRLAPTYAARFIWIAKEPTRLIL